MSGVGEATLGEGKDFGWANGKHERGPDVVSKGPRRCSAQQSPLRRPRGPERRRAGDFVGPLAAKD